MLIQARQLKTGKWLLPLLDILAGGGLLVTGGFNLAKYNLGLTEIGFWWSGGLFLIGLVVVRLTLAWKHRHDANMWLFTAASFFGFWTGMASNFRWPVLVAWFVIDLCSLLSGFLAIVTGDQRPGHHS